MKLKVPPGFILKTVKFVNGTTKLVAISEKSYRSPRLWNGKRWVTCPNKY